MEILYSIENLLHQFYYAHGLCMALSNLLQGLCASPLCNPSVHPPLYTCSTIRGSTTCRSVAQRHACTYAYTAYISSRQHLRIPSVHPLCATRPCLACARQPCARQKRNTFSIEYSNAGPPAWACNKIRANLLSWGLPPPTPLGLPGGGAGRPQTLK